MENYKEILKKIGEETIFSAKGHFKANDFRRILTHFVILGCITLNILGVIGIEPTIDKWLSAVGLFGNICMLYWEAEGGKDYRTKHKQIGEEYLNFTQKSTKFILQI